MASATLTPKGQITLPKPVRDRLGLKPGDRITFREREDGSIVLEPESEDLLQLRGSVRPRVRGVTVEAMNEAIRRRADKP
jgi:AbrB family looped-hinge helix DNA binding protein